MCRFIVYLVVLCFISASSIGQDKQLEKKLDGLLASQPGPPQPGCAVLVAKGGKIIYKKSVGSANLQLNVL